MSRIGLVIALALAAAAAFAFALRPSLDLAVSAYFFDPVRGGFPLRPSAAIGGLRTVAEWVLVLLAAPAVIALVGKFLLPRRPMLIPGRAAVFLLATLALGPGLLVNGLLKEHWGRPRPVAVTEFGGALPHVPWWDPRGQCPRNCSFVSGEGSSAFWTLAPAALAPPAWRGLAFAAAAAYGAVLGGLRVAVGAHFLSDVIFAGILTFLVIWLVHGFLYRWPATRTTDAAIERGIERAAAPLHTALSSAFGLLAARMRPPSRRPPEG